MSIKDVSFFQLIFLLAYFCFRKCPYITITIINLLRKNDQHTYSYDNKLYMLIKGTMDENETYRNIKLMDNLTEPTKREAVYNHEQGKFVFLSFLI